MSRIGNRVLTIPTGVNVTFENDTLTVKGPKGSLDFPVSKEVIVKIEENTVSVEKTDSENSNILKNKNEEIKMSKRTGKTITITELIEEVGINAA